MNQFPRTVADMTDEELLCRVVSHIIKTRPKKEPAWAAIKRGFCLGSTYSAQLCRRFGYDPETGKKEEESGQS